MSWLYEDSTTVLWVGGLVAVLLAAAWYSTRRWVWLAPIGGVVLLMLLAVLIERLVETPRERVARTLQTVAAELERGDVVAALAHIDPRAGLTQQQAKQVAAVLEFEEIKLKDLQIRFNDLTTPPTARARFLVDVRARQRGGASQRILRQLNVVLIHVDDRWLISEYQDDGPPRL